MRRNRRVRDQIEERLGPEAVAEISRWNDDRIDLLDDFGVPLTELEIAAQEADYDELLAFEWSDLGTI